MKDASCLFGQTNKISKTAVSDWWSLLSTCGGSSSTGTDGGEDTASYTIKVCRRYTRSHHDSDTAINHKEDDVFQRERSYTFTLKTTGSVTQTIAVDSIANVNFLVSADDVGLTGDGCAAGSYKRTATIDVLIDEDGDGNNYEQYALVDGDNIKDNGKEFYSGFSGSVVGGDLELSTSCYALSDCSDSDLSDNLYADGNTNVVHEFVVYKTIGSHVYANRVTVTTTLTQCPLDGSGSILESDDL